MILKGSAHIFGVVGYPVKHSLSPVFQNKALEHLGIEGVYIPLEIPPEEVKEVILGLRSVENLVGLNITVPHKEILMEVCDTLEDHAKTIGSVNTLKFSEGRIEGYNTDWIGFLKSAEEVVDLKGKRVLMLGAGGAGRAVIYALKQAEAEVVLWNRTKEKAVALAEEFGVEVAEDIKSALETAEVIVNTTSVGLKAEDPPIFDYSLIREDQVVIDIIYKETPLIKSAREKGCKVQTGFPMLVYQGAESFKIWTGCEAPVKIMKLSLKEYGYPIDSPKSLQRT